MAEDDSYLMCMRVADLTVAVPGSTKKRCSACARPVWVSPASLDLSRKRHIPLLCIPCAEERAAKDEDGMVIQPLTEEQIKEIRDAIERG
jgi:hypothetical protein